MLGGGGKHGANNTHWQNEQTEAKAEMKKFAN